LILTNIYKPDETILQVAEIQKLPGTRRLEFRQLSRFINLVEESAGNYGQDHPPGLSSIFWYQGNANAISELPHFHGVERRAWLDPFDMISLNPTRRPNDLGDIIIWIFRRFKILFTDKKSLTDIRYRNPVGRSISYIRDFMQYIFDILQSAIVATIPGVSVLILYEVHNIQKRIYVLIGLTIAFAIIVKVANLTRKVDMFSVTAA
jgi:hypothetical protein